MIEPGREFMSVMPVNLFYPFKMINKAVEKVEGFSKNANKIIDLAEVVDNSVGSGGWY